MPRRRKEAIQPLSQSRKIHTARLVGETTEDILCKLPLVRPVAMEIQAAGVV
jgi:hypothetical protein